jgi:hypothetical protein
MNLKIVYYDMSLIRSILQDLGHEELAKTAME